MCSCARQFIFGSTFTTRLQISFLCNFNQILTIVGTNCIFGLVQVSSYNLLRTDSKLRIVRRLGKKVYFWTDVYDAPKIRFSCNLTKILTIFACSKFKVTYFCWKVGDCVNKLIFGPTVTTRLKISSSSCTILIKLILIVF